MQDNPLPEACRNLSYIQALDESLLLNMEEDSRIFVMGIGLTESPLVYSTLKNAAQRWPSRILNTPISEDALTGFALGASLGGKIPVTVHMRADFMLLCMNQLVNIIAPYTYATGKKTPMVFRVIIGRGWGQGYQHSKSLISTLAHIPGLTVVAPVTPADAKGMLTYALTKAEGPIIFMEHRWLYFAESHVPYENYSTPLQSKIVKEGRDVKIMASTWMVVEALKAADIMQKRGISVGVLDICNLSHPTFSLISRWARTTPHTIIADYDWQFCGLSAELLEEVPGSIRVTWPDAHVPTSREKENKFYPNALTLLRVVEQQLKLPAMSYENEDFYSWENKFKGPF